VHREFLFLFEVAVFVKNSITETRLYLDWEIHTVDEKPMADVVTNVDKELTILIHSDNSQFPSESESLKRAIRRIINDAVENCI
jgi:hypothetical protein